MSTKSEAISSNRDLAILCAGIALCGLGMLGCAFGTYRNAMMGTVAQARVASCSGRDGQYTHVTCEGTWVVGGARVGGNGHVEYGVVSGADYPDLGHTLEVRIHGGTAYATGVALPILLLVFGLFIFGGAIWLYFASR